MDLVDIGMIALPLREMERYERMMKRIPGSRYKDGRWWVPKARKSLTSNVLEKNGFNKLSKALDKGLSQESGPVSPKYEESLAASSDIVIPAPEGCEYRPFQKAGVNFMKWNDASLCADEQGIGKTMQSIGLFNFRKHKKGLFIAPANVKINWERELNKWLVGRNSILVVEGNVPPEEFERNNIVVINYDILKKYLGVLVHTKWDYISVDEAHYVKNANAQRSFCVRQIVEANRSNAQIVFLTGTPMSTPEDIFNLINMLDPIQFENKKVFEQAFCVYRDIFIPGGRKIRKCVAGKNLDKLQDMLRSTIMIRRMKKDVMKELPPKTRQVISFRANRAEYKKLMKEEQRLMPDFDKMSEVEFKRAIRKSNFEMNSGEAGDLARIRHQMGLAKIPDCVSFIQDVLENVEKVVVFAHHKDVQATILKHFGKIAIGGKIEGGSQRARYERVQKFQKDPKVRVFVASLAGDGVGITLTAAHTVVFCELDWDDKKMSQAEDRCHRYGRYDNVTVYHLVVENSIDNMIAKTLFSKEATVQAGLNAEEE